MKASALKKGQRVRVTIEGDVSSFVHKPDAQLTGVWVKSDFSEYHFPVEGTAFEPVEPEYVHGAIYQDAMGEVMRYQEPAALGVKRGWLLINGPLWCFDAATRPLVRLVPESGPECDRVGGCLKRLHMNCKCDVVAG